MSILAVYNGRVGFEARLLWDSGIMKRGTYDKNVTRQRIEVLQRSAPGVPAIVAYDTLPKKVKEKVDTLLVNSGEVTTERDTDRVSVFASMIRPDAAARSYFADYQLEDGRSLPADAQQEYYANACVLNAVAEMLVLRKGRRDACGVSGNKQHGLMASVCADVNSLDKGVWAHTLPSNERRLRERLNSYMANGVRNYESLIHKNYCNQHSRKVTEDMKWLLLSLYCQKNNPYAEWIHEQYLLFLAGGIDVVDGRTGEVFDRRNFCV